MFKQRDDNAPAGAERLAQLSRGRGAMSSQKLNCHIGRARQGFRQQHNLFTQSNGLASLQKKAERLLRSRIRREFFA